MIATLYSDLHQATGVPPFDINSVEHQMLDREKIVAVLKKRFAGAGTDQIAAATNAIIGLEEEWEELTSSDANLCSDSCILTKTAQDRTRFKVFKRRLND